LYSVVAWGDYDNDGDLDLAVCGQRNSKIYKNNGYGIFTDIAAVLPKTAITGAFAWGDYDNDGDLDFAINGADFTRIYKNEGNDTFIDIGKELPSLCYFVREHQFGSGSIGWGDYDNDGDLDIVLSGARGFVKIYRNNGDETFTDVEATGFTGVTYSSIAWGDYDNDGDLDLAICGSIGGYVGAPTITSIYRNNGDSTFTDINAGLPGTSRVSLAWGDYDNDGDLDLAVNGLGIYKNNGDDTFTNIGVAVRGGDHASLVWGDYDNDGDLDIAACGGYKTIVYNNNGDNTFTDINAGLTGVSMGDLAWGDYDNDGDLDLVVSGYIAAPTITKIYKNLEADSVGNSNPNLFASPPTLLPQEPHSNILKWNSGYDEETPTDGLYYHIRVGTVSGKDDIVSGVYGSPLLGNYLRPKVSNEQLGIRLNNLPISGGTYYWSVKTIDTGLQASEWSDEGTFVSNNIPIADAGLDQTIYAWFDGIAKVILDGTGSYDEDGQDLTYNWSWIVDSNSFTAAGPRPVIELPVGEHIVELIVNDGIDDSEPNWVFITVLPAIEVAMKLTPQTFNLYSKGKWIKSHFVLPEGFSVEDVNANATAVIEPLGIESEYMNVSINEDGLVEIEAAFSRAAFAAAGIDYEPAEIAVVGLLTSGQYFYGTDTIRIITNNLQFVAALASHWLEADCGQPDWCNGLDIDQSTTVDFVDFAMFEGCYIEVVE
jgi:hypothetical protein